MPALTPVPPPTRPTVEELQPPHRHHRNRPHSQQQQLQQQQRCCKGPSAGVRGVLDRGGAGARTRAALCRNKGRPCKGYGKHYGACYVDIQAVLSCLNTHA